MEPKGQKHGIGVVRAEIERLSVEECAEKHDEHEQFEMGSAVVLKVCISWL